MYIQKQAAQVKKSCAASARATTLKILRRKHMRECNVLKSIILIDSLLKLCKATIWNQYSKQIMHATKYVNKRLLISFKKYIQAFENGAKNVFIPYKKILSTPALKETRV